MGRVRQARAMGRVDLHNHLLPGLDDGARTLDEALALARLLVSAGYSDVVATPHSRPDLAPDDALVAARLVDLQVRVDAEGIALRLHHGREHHLTPEFVEAVRARTARTLGASPWLLVELPFASPVQGLAHTMFELRKAGYRALFAHPERCAHFVGRLDAAREVVENGGLLQLEAGSLAGLHGEPARRTARQLLDANLVAVVATDAHQPGPATELLDLGLATLARTVGAERLAQLTEEHPRTLLAGGRIPLP